MSDTSRSESSFLYVLQQRISIFTWLITLLLSWRGMYDMYGMKVPGDVELAVRGMTDPVVATFNFNFLHSLEYIPGIVPLFTVVSFLLLSMTVQTVLRIVNVRWTQADVLLAHYIVSKKRRRTRG